MKRLRFGVACVTLLAGIAASAQAPAEQPRETVRLFFDDASAPPSTLQELWNAASLVLEANIGDDAPADFVDASPERPVVDIRTAFQLVDIHVIKSDSPDQQPLVLMLPGGDRPQGNTIVTYVAPAFERPKKNQRYLLFLQVDTRGGGYYPATHGPESMFRLEGDQVIPMGHSPLSREIARLSPATLLASIAAVKNGGAR